MQPGGPREHTERANSGAGGSESAYGREGQFGPSEAGPGQEILLTPSPRSHVRKTINGVRASNKFTAVGWPSLERSDDWYRWNYNHAIATWLRECSRSHARICNCGQFRKHWFQECAGLQDNTSQTELEDAILQPVLRSGQRAKRKLDYIQNSSGPQRKTKTVTWRDELADQEDDSMDSPEESGEDSDDVDGFAPSFELGGDGGLVDELLRGPSTTRTQARIL